MIELLDWVFHDILRFVGVIILLIVLGWVLESIALAIRGRAGQ